MNIWNDTQLLDKLDAVRSGLRLKGKRLTFDCLNLKCRGERVHCAKGKLLGQARDGSLALITVLRGMTSGACVNCGDFEGGDDG